jgi:hypothetical protein
MLEARIFAHLSTTADVIAIVSKRIYPLILPQDPTLPAITYQRIAGTRINCITEGYVSLENAIVQIDCWSTSFDVLTDLATKVIAAMWASKTFSALVPNSPIDLYEDDVLAYRRSIDVSVWNRE